MLQPEREQPGPQLFLVPKPKWFERSLSTPTVTAASQEPSSEPRSNVIVPLEDTTLLLLAATPPVGGSALDRLAYRIFMGQLGDAVASWEADPSSLYGQHLLFVGEAPRFDPSYAEDVRHDAMHPAARRAKARWFLREPSPAIGDSGGPSSTILDDLNPGVLRDRVAQAWFRGSDPVGVFPDIAKQAADLMARRSIPYKEDVLSVADSYRELLFNNMKTAVASLIELTKGQRLFDEVVKIFFSRVFFRDNLDKSFLEQCFVRLFLLPAFHTFSETECFSFMRGFRSGFFTAQFFELAYQGLHDAAAAVWGTPIPVYSTELRNDQFFKLVLHRLLPALELGEVHPIIHLVGDGEGSSTVRFLELLGEERWSDTTVVSSNLMRDLTYRTSGDLSTIRGSNGQLLLTRRGNQVFSGKESDGQCDNGVDHSCTIPLIDDRLADGLLRYPNNIFSAEADLFDTNSLVRATGGHKAHVLLLLNVLTAGRFSKKQLQLSLRNLGQSVEEGGFILIGGLSFRAWRGCEGTVYQKRGTSLFRVDDRFGIDVISTIQFDPVIAVD